MMMINAMYSSILQAMQAILMICKQSITYAAQVKALPCLQTLALGISYHMYRAFGGLQCWDGVTHYSAFVNAISAELKKWLIIKH